MNTLSLPLLLGIFIGGGSGTVLRYFLGIWLNSKHLIPMGTLTANVLATSFLALVTFKITHRFPEGHAFPAALAIGFCGGFSTFSTFSAENHRLIAEGNWWWAALNITVSVLGCILVFAIVAATVRR